MDILKGIASSRGAGLGKVHIAFSKSTIVSPTYSSNPELEMQRFEEACAKAIQQLMDLYNETLKNIGRDEAMIFEIHQMMLDDLDYKEAIFSFIRDDNNAAEYAVFRAGEQFAIVFSEMEDPYIRERAADIRDISQRVVRILTGEQDANDLAPAEPYILAADDLYPSQTVRLDTSKVLAFVTRQGSHNSHASILARTLGIPAVVGIKEGFERIEAGIIAGVDGSAGEVFLSPDHEQIARFGQMIQTHHEHRELLARQKGLPSVSLDGTAMEICANVGSTKDITAVLDNDADGIGLFRSEFLYMEGDDYPDEEQQFEAYKYVLAKMRGKRVIVRTFDIGADKTAPYMHFPSEDNPAMGCRAIRVCLRNKPLFKTQLRALLRASVFGKLAVMLPMISSLEEFREAKKLFYECKQELKDQGYDVSDAVELGMMVEVPSAAVCSDQFAREVDFFSIGTNDLTQFVLAVDRMNGKIEDLYDHAHPAVLRLMEMTAKAARENGIWCGICGEAAADTLLTETYMRMGISELSVTPNAVLEVREKVRSIDLDSVPPEKTY